MLLRTRVLIAGLGVGLLVTPSLPALAQSAPCPILSDQAVSNVLGGPVQTTAHPNAAPNLDACDFVDSSGTDYAVNHETGAFQADELQGPGMLALKYLPVVSEQALSQLAGLTQPDQKVSLPGYDISSLSGLGDAAVMIKSTDSGGTQDSLLVERGQDVFGFGATDAPDTQSKLTSLAQAALTPGP